MTHLLALLLAACTPKEQDQQADTPAEPAPRRHDVILVTLDTTRADRIGAYGYAGAGTTFIDGLAARGRRYAQAYSPLSLTIPAHASIMTGLAPYHHGIRANGDNVLDESFRTLAERLKDEGYQTGAAVGAFVTTRLWGFGQGFDWYRDEIPGGQGDTWHQERRAQAVVDDALDILGLAADGRPLFLWVHLYDGHFPYAPPREYADTWLERPYDGELAYMDDQLERLGAAVQAKGRDPLWVVVGDHGEGQAEHAELTHGLYVYEGTQRVPFVVAGPGVQPGVVDQPVGLVDVSPTILSLLGLDAGAGLDGQPQPGNPQPVYMESYQPTERFSYAPHVGVVDGPLKYISKPRPELYDVVADPAEATNLVGTRPDDAARLRGILESLAAPPPGNRTAALDPEALAQLEALGYVTGQPLTADFENLPDPQDKADVVSRIQRADLAARAGKIDVAIKVLEEAATLEPNLANTRVRLARLLARNGEPDKAAAILADAQKANPEDTTVRLSAAIIAGQAGRHAEALEEARFVLGKEPDNVAAAEVVARALANLGQLAELDSFGKTYLADNPTAYPVAAVIGIVHFEIQDYKGAEPLLRQAAKADQPTVGVCRRLGVLAAAVEKYDDAEQWARRELELHPADLGARRLLARVLAKKGDEAGAITILDRILQDLPKDPVLYYDKGVGQLNLGQKDAALVTVDQGLTQVPDDPDLTMLKANVLNALGRTEEALALRDKAIALNEKRKAEEAASPKADKPPAPALRSKAGGPRGKVPGRGKAKSPAE